MFEHPFRRYVTAQFDAVATTGLENNMSLTNVDRVTAIVPPRVVRLGARINF